MSLPPWLSGPPAGVAAKSAAIAAATRKPHLRAVQPGRRVKRRDTRAADMDPDAYGYDVGDDDDTDPRVRAGSETQRSQREEKKWGAFSERRERATSNLLRGAVAAAGFRDELRRLTEVLLQEYTNCAATRHCCFVHGLTSEPPTVVGTFRLKVQDLTAWYEVTVPRLCCAACGTWDVQAEECGCFPASPTDPQLWFMVPVLEFFNQLLLRNGQSAEGAARRGAAQRGATLLSIDSPLHAGFAGTLEVIADGAANEEQISNAHLEYFRCFACVAQVEGERTRALLHLCPGVDAPARAGPGSSSADRRGWAQKACPKTRSRTALRVPTWLTRTGRRRSRPA